MNWPNGAKGRLGKGKKEKHGSEGEKKWAETKEGSCINHKNFWASGQESSGVRNRLQERGDESPSEWKGRSAERRGPPIQPRLQIMNLVKKKRRV